MEKLNIQEANACPKKLSREPFIPSTVASLSEKAWSFLMKNNKYPKRRTVKEKKTPWVEQTLHSIESFKAQHFFIWEFLCSSNPWYTFSRCSLFQSFPFTWFDYFSAWQLFHERRCSFVQKLREFHVFGDFSFSVFYAAFPSRTLFQTESFATKMCLLRESKMSKLPFLLKKNSHVRIYGCEIFFEKIFWKTNQSKNLICSDFSAWRYDSRFVFQVIFEYYYLRQKLNSFCCREQKREDQFLVFC